MPIQALVDGDSPIHSDETGFAFDLRPGSNPDDWVFDGTYAWPLTDRPNIITLLPAVLDDAWGTTQADSGIYARDRLEHYEQVAGFPFTPTTGAWEEYPRLHPKDYVFLGKTVGAGVKTKTDLDAGSGLVVHFQPFGAQIGTGTVLSVQFGHPDPDRAFWLNVREDGKAYLSRGVAIPTPIEAQLAEGNVFAARRGSLIGQWNKLFILPHGRNRLLIAGGAASEGGAGFVWEDPDLSRADYPASEDPGVAPRRSPADSGSGGALARSGTGDPVITSYPTVTKKAPVVVAGPHKTAIQVKRLMFVDDGTVKPKGPPLTGVPYSNTRTPIRWPVTSPHDAPQRTPVVQDAPPGWPIQVIHSPVYRLGNQKAVTPTVQFHRPPTKPDSTPILYRFEPAADGVVSKVAKAGTDLAPDMIELRHAQDGDGDARMTGTARFRFGQNHADYQKRFNIPFHFTETDSDGTTQTWIQAFLAEPKIETNGAQVFLEWQLVDWWRMLETTYLKAIGRFDGLTISDAVKAVLITAGWPKDGSLWRITDTAVKVSKGEADDNSTNLTDAARTAAEWLKYLNETYTSASVLPFRWIMGFWPELDLDTGLFVNAFHFQNPETLDRTPVKEWWPRPDEALAAGIPEAQVYRSVYRNYSNDAIEPEANDFYVWGQDASDKVFFAHKEDRNSIKADTPLVERPANWLGERRQDLVQDAALNTQALVTGACQRYFQRLSPARERATFEAEWEPAVTLYKQVRLYTFDSTSTLTSADWTVTGIDVTHRQDAPTHPRSGRPISNRPTTYRVERILDETAVPPPVPPASSRLFSGTATAIVTAGPLAPSRPVDRVLVQNLPTNSQDVFVGSASSQTVLLRPGTDSDWIDIDNLAKVSIRTSSGTASVGYIAVGD